jgi:hypothetical protein
LYAQSGLAAVGSYEGDRNDEELKEGFYFDELDLEYFYNC